MLLFVSQFVTELMEGMIYKGRTMTSLFCEKHRDLEESDVNYMCCKT